jgi:hypothetical protein
MSALKYNFFILKLLALQSFGIKVIKLLIMILTEITWCCHLSFYLIYFEIQIQISLFIIIQRVVLKYIKVLLFQIFVKVILMTVWVLNVYVLKFIFFTLILKQDIYILLPQTLILILIKLLILFILVDMIYFRLESWSTTVDGILLYVV